jgi:cyanophycinase
MLPSNVTGLLALVGGDEFKPGNEEQDRMLVAAARSRGGPAYVVPTAAARGGPEQAVANATRWFAGLGLELVELHVLTRTHANSEELAAQAERGSLFYLVGGDPGHTASTLRDSRVWRAMERTWQAGAALAGSSAGAMALGEWTLIRDRFKGDHRRQYRPALAAVPRVAVVPHFETFGHRWLESAAERAPRSDAILLGIDERSAAVWDGRGWTARGPGSVTVIQQGERVAGRSGEPVLGLPEPGDN